MKFDINNHLGLKGILTVLVYLGTGLSLFSQTEKQLVIGQQPVYKVSRARDPIIVDGRMDEAAGRMLKYSYSIIFTEATDLSKNSLPSSECYGMMKICIYFTNAKTHLSQHVKQNLTAGLILTIVLNFFVFRYQTVSILIFHSSTSDFQFL